MNEPTERFRVEPAEGGRRIDEVLRERIAGRSRSAIQNLIRQGMVLVNGRQVKTGYAARPGDEVSVTLPEPEEPDLTPWDHPLSILHEDEGFLVIDKPPGLVVHPAPGNWSRTLVHALLGRRQLSTGGDLLRPGIVHRLDKDTSGVLLVACSDRTHASLARQFQQGGVRKAYLALVRGTPEADQGVIDDPIGRHPVERTKMSTRSRKGKPALTVWRVAERFPAGVSLLTVEIKTGRTHQIRVHLARMGFPVLGDPVYGGAKASPRSLGDERFRDLVKRQMLHARSIGFTHPDSGQWMSFEAPLPPDMEKVLELLRRDEIGGKTLHTS